MACEGEAPLQPTGARGRRRGLGLASPCPSRLRFPPRRALGGEGAGRAGHRAARGQGGEGHGAGRGTGRAGHRAARAARVLLRPRGREAGGPGGHGGTWRAAGHGRERLGEVGRGCRGRGGRGERPGGGGAVQVSPVLVPGPRRWEGPREPRLLFADEETEARGTCPLCPPPARSPWGTWPGTRPRPGVSSCARRVPAKALCKGPTRARSGCTVAMPPFGGLWSEQGARGQTRRPLTFVGLGRVAASSCEALA